MLFPRIPRDPPGRMSGGTRFRRRLRGSADHFVKLDQLPEDFAIPSKFENRLEFDAESPPPRLSRLHEQVRVPPAQLAHQGLAIPSHPRRPLSPSARPKPHPPRPVSAEYWQISASSFPGGEKSPARIQDRPVLVRESVSVNSKRGARHPINVDDSDAAIYAPSPCGRGPG